MFVTMTTTIAYCLFSIAYCLLPFALFYMFHTFTFYSFQTTASITR
jgi:hypothetical protein